MNGQTRYVNIRGFAVRVTVINKNSRGEWNVSYPTHNKYNPVAVESVPEHHFYHIGKKGLWLRDSSRFQRQYASHPVEVEKLGVSTVKTGRAVQSFTNKS